MNDEAARDGKDKIDAKIFSYIIPPSTRAPRTKQAKEQPIEWLNERVQGSDKMRKSPLSISFRAAGCGPNESIGCGIAIIVPSTAEYPRKAKPLVA